MPLTILILEDEDENGAALSPTKKIYIKKIWTHYVDRKTFNTSFEKDSQMVLYFVFSDNQPVS